MDPFTFVVWISEERVRQLPRQPDALFLNSLMQPPDDEHVEFVKRLRDPDDKVTAVTAFTAYAHEWRHWYDSTSTPWGMARTSLLLDFYVTLQGADEELRERREIFVPMVSWKGQSDVLRDVYPHLEPMSDATEHIVAKAAQSMRDLDRRLLHGELVAGRSISPLQILEALAMLQQETLAESVFGSSSARMIREHILRTAQGPTYYSAIEAVEEALGTTDRAVVTKVLDATLHVGAALAADEERLTPGRFLARLLGLPRRQLLNNTEEAIDSTLQELSGRDREESVRRTYDEADSWIGGIVDQADSLSSNLAANLAAKIRVALKWGNAARCDSQLWVPVWTGGDVDTFLPTKVSPDPYSYLAPVVVEGFGRLLPRPYAINEGYVPLAGPEDDGTVFLDANPALNILGLFRGHRADKFVNLVVWTPRRSSDQMDFLPYLGLPTLLPELMYWRGAMFGPGSISPATFASTALAKAYERNQKLLGPQISAGSSKVEFLPQTRLERLLRRPPRRKPMSVTEHIHSIYRNVT